MVARGLGTSLRGRNLISINDLSKEEMELILDVAEELMHLASGGTWLEPKLEGKTVVMLFYEPSTRTRTSFEAAAKNLGMNTISISEEASSAVKGESLADTARTLEAMKIDAIVVRHPLAGAPYIVAKNTSAVVVNAGDGCHEHPTQCLLDLLTIRSKKERTSGLRVAIVGDILHSRVARSNIFGFSRMGMEVCLVAPRTLLPPDVKAFGVQVFSRLDDVISDLDVLYMLRIQKERQTRCFFPTLREYTRYYGLGRSLLDKAKSGVLVMHPGPVNRGVEIESLAADSPQSVISEQVRYGVAVRMALLYLALSDSSEARTGDAHRS